MSSETAERIATGNEAALRFWLRATGGVVLADHAALRRFAASDPAAYEAAIIAFAGIGGPPRRLARRGCGHAALVLRCADGARIALDGAMLGHGEVAGLPDDLTGDLSRVWPASSLVPALAALLLEGDLRPDDRLLVAGLPPWPWLAALTQDIPLILCQDASAATLAAIAGVEDATVVAAPADWLRAAGLAEAPPSGPRGLYPEFWPSDAAAPTLPGVVPNTARNAAPKAGRLA